MLAQKLMGAKAVAVGGQITFASASTLQFNNTDPTDVPAPSGIVEGDLLIAFYAHNFGGATLTPPEGWTTELFTGFDGFGIYSKIATSSEPSAYTFKSNINANQRVSIARFSGGAGLIDVVGSLATSSVTSVSAPSITATQDGLLIAFSSSGGASASLSSAPSGMDEAFYFNVGAPRSTMYSAEQAAGSTGAKTFTWSVTNTKLAVLLQLY